MGWKFVDGGRCLRPTRFHDMVCSCTILSEEILKSRGTGLRQDETYDGVTRRIGTHLRQLGKGRRERCIEVGGS